MVIMSRYKEADLKKMKVTQLRALVHKADIHGVKVAGARKEQLIIALMTGEFPGDSENTEQHKKLAAAFAGLLDLLADAVAERLRKGKMRG